MVTVYAEPREPQLRSAAVESTQDNEQLITSAGGCSQISKLERQELQAFHNRCQRRVLGVQFITNAEVAAGTRLTDS